MRATNPKSWSTWMVASAIVVGCGTGESGIESLQSIEQGAVTGENGLRSINGLRSKNGLTSVNGLRTRNGLSTLTGLSSTTGLMTTPEGRATVTYLVRCALAADQTITKQDQNGVSYTFKGQIGIAPEWADAECDLTCQESVSACMLAHVNTTGANIPLWLVGNVPSIGWGQSVNYPNQEGSFFGNIFVDPPTAYYCNGEGFDKGVVPGRIGADQVGAPYVNPLASVGGACKTVCTPMDIPNQKDGYKACYGFNHVLTVWRSDGATSTGATGAATADAGTVVGDASTGVSSTATTWRRRRY